MRKILGVAAILMAVVGYVGAASAACPPGTKYDCVPMANGKQSCGCR